MSDSQDSLLHWEQETECRIWNRGQRKQNGAAVKPRRERTPKPELIRPLV
jgi:hypothetical protein